MSILSDLALFLWILLHRFAYLAPILFAASLIGAALEVYAPRLVVERVVGAGLRGIAVCSLLGFALPLCSCTVVPVAAGLRRSGASAGAVASLIVSAPALSPVSLSLCLALLGPRIALLYVMTALAASMAVGLAVEAISRGEPSKRCIGCARCAVERRRAFAEIALHRVREVFLWSLLGLSVATTLTLFVPPTAFSSLRFPMGVATALAISLPLYICPPAAIPMAAALLERGMCLAGALTLMILGPTTNAGNIALVARAMGGRACGAYLATLIATVVAASMTANTLLQQT